MPKRQRHEAFPSSPEEAVGWRCEVFWAGKSLIPDEWYAGVVSSFSATRGFRIKYDDGETAWEAVGNSCDPLGSPRRIHWLEAPRASQDVAPGLLLAASAALASSSGQPSPQKRYVPKPSPLPPGLSPALAPGGMPAKATGGFYGTLRAQAQAVLQRQAQLPPPPQPTADKQQWQQPAHSTSHDVAPRAHATDMLLANGSVTESAPPHAASGVGAQLDAVAPSAIARALVAKAVARVDRAPSAVQEVAAAKGAESAMPAAPAAANAPHVAPVSAVAAGETSTFDAAVSQLHGKRKVVPTMVQIGSQFVKRQNLYDMDTGERGAFELDHAYDDAFAPRERGVASASTAAEHVAPKLPAPARAPYVPSEAERRRTANNDALKADGVVLAERRACFFHEHRARIEPFVEGKVLSALATATAAAPVAPPRRPLLCQPETIVGGELRDYQLVALEWMVDCIERLGLSPILGDEMGLGKTLQTIAVIAHLKHHLKLAGACLVVCPLSVLPTWCAELDRWCPSLRVIKLHSVDPAERERLKQRVSDEVGSFDVVVTTYEMVKSPSLRSCLVQKSYVTATDFESTDGDD